MNKQLLLKIRLFVAMLAMIALVGCATKVRRESVPMGRNMPSWYKNVDPAPDSEFYYFTGYAERCFSFSQARRLAEREARERLSQFIGTDVISRIESALMRNGEDWAHLANETGIWADLGLTSGYEDSLRPAMSKEQIKQNLITISNNLVKSSRQKDLYVEKVIVKKSVLDKPGIRYDAGVLVEFPRKEFDRLQELTKMEMQENAAGSTVVSKAARLWGAGEKAQAVAVLQKARRNQPYNSRIAIILGGYLEDMGRRERAREIYSSIAELPGDNEDIAHARARMTSLTNKNLSDMLRVFKKHGLEQENLVDVVIWTQNGNLSRARKMAREFAQRDGEQSPYNWMWYMASQVEYNETQSQSALYDLEQSRTLTGQQMQGWQSPADAEPAIFTLLNYANTDVGEEVAFKNLNRIRERFPKPQQQFSKGLQDAAVMTLAPKKQKSKAASILDWIGTAAQTAQTINSILN